MQELNSQISLSEASKLSGYSVAHLRRLCVSGNLKAIKVGKTWLTTPADLDQFIVGLEGKPVTLDQVIGTSVFSYSKLQKYAATAVAVAVFFPVAGHLVQLTDKLAYLRDKTNQVTVSTQTIINRQVEDYIAQRLAKLGLNNRQDAVQTPVVSGSAEIFPTNPTHPALDAGSNQGKIPASAGMGQEMPGKVLGEITTDQVLTTLRQIVFNEGLPEDLKVALQGPAGPQGPQGERGPEAQYIPNSGSVFGITAPTAPQGSAGTIGSATYLSSREFHTEKLIVTADATLNGPLTVNDDVSISGDLNLTGGFNISGNATFTGNILPGTDDTFDLGSTTARWNNLHLGPTGLIVHNDTTDTSTLNLNFSGATAQVKTDAATALQLTTGANPGITLDTSGNFTLDTGDFSQLGARTFSTGTGNVSFNGATTVTGANTFATGTGTVTFNNVTTNLAATDPVIDLTSASTLNINTTTNRPVTFGTGLVTIPNLVVTNSQSNNGTMIIDSAATTATIFEVRGNSLTSGTAILKTVTANAGNGQVTKGEILNLTDSTTAGGGFTGIGIAVTGAGTGSGNKYLLSLNPNTANNEVVFDNTGAFRPTTSVASNTATIGSASFYWKNGYFDQITANNLAGTVITGATSSTTWTIGSTEAGDVNEAIIFQRNSGSGNATLQWNAGANDLRYLSVNYPFNSTYTVSDASIGTGINLYSGNLTNNTTGGTQKLLSLTNTGTGTTETGIYINNTGTAETAFEIAGTWTNGIITNNNSINVGTGTITSGSLASSGNITIGKADPTVIFDVATATDTDFWVGVQDDAGGDDDDLFQIGDGTTPGTNPFVTINTAGNVGIGTTAPFEQLEVAAASGGRMIVSDREGSTRRYLLMQSPTSTEAYARILAYNIAGNAPVNIALQDTGGYVGIGTTNPSGLLHVKSAVTADSFVIIDTTTADAAGSDAYLSLREAGTEKWKIRSQGDGNDVLKISSASVNPVLTMTQAGNVGIGTTAPGYKLDVLGSVRFDGTGADWIWDAAGGLTPGYLTGAFNINSQALTNASFISFVTNPATAGTIRMPNTGDIQWRNAANSANVVGVAFGTDNNLQLMPNGGNVGIGDTSPAALLTVGGGDLFQVASTGHVRSISGSVSAPTYSFTADTDNGLYYIGIDNIGISVGGVKRIDIDGTRTMFQNRIELNSDNSHDIGQVAAGRPRTGYFGTSVVAPTISATSALSSTGNLTITKADPSIILDTTTATDTDFWISVTDDAGSDDDDLFQIGDGTTPGTNPFVTINTAGNVGIGNIDPQGKLQVDGSVYVASANGALDYAVSIGGLNAAEGGIGYNTKFGASYTYGGTDFASMLEFPAGGFRFKTAASGTAGNAITFTTRMELSQLGNLNLGGGATAARLHVGASQSTKTTTGDSRMLILENTDGGVVANNKLEIGFGYKAAATYQPVVIGTKVNSVGTFTKDDFYIATRDVTTDTAPTERFYITSAGNVGIGTTNPASKLAVHSTSSGSVLEIGNIGSGASGNGRYESITFANDHENGNKHNSAEIRATMDLLYSGYLSFYVKPGDNNSAGALVETMRITTGAANNTGSVGIGTTNPAYKLEVIGGARLSGALRMENDQRITWGSVAGEGITGNQATNSLTFRTNSTDRVTINSSGYVGIGTTTPSSKLDITTAGLAATQTTSSGLALVNTTAATALAPVQISPAIRWSGFGWKTDVTAASQAVDFRAFVTPVQGTASPAGYLGFGSSINGGAYNDNQLVLTSTGNVGIGTTNPGTKLHLFGTNATDVYQSFSRDVAAVSGHGLGVLNFYGTQSGATNKNRQGAMINIHADGSWGTDDANFAPTDIDFYTQDASTNNTLSTPRMTIKSSGKVGIGTTNPTANLHVIGLSSDKYLTFGNGFYLQATNGSTPVAQINGLGVADILQVQDAGTPVFVVKDGGSVGIGTTNPDTKLQVYGDSGNLLKLQSSTGMSVAGQAIGMSFVQSTNIEVGRIESITETSLNIGMRFFTYPGAERMRIAGDGDVGIGYTDPGTAKLAVNGNVGIGTTNPENALAISSEGPSTAAIKIGAAANATGIYAFMGYDPNGISTGFIGNAYDNDTAAFQVRMKGTSNSDAKLTVLGSGNVGIGTTSPDSLLEVSANANAQIKVTDADNSVELLLNASDGVGGVVQIGSITNHPLRLLANNGGRVEILANGNVGIGTQSPGAKLDVRGSFNAGTNGTEFTVDATGNVTAAGNIVLAGNQTISTGGNVNISGAAGLILSNTSNGTIDNTGSGLLFIQNTGSTIFRGTSPGYAEQFRVAHTSSAVNYLQVTGAAASGAPTISAQGSDTNIQLTIASKGNYPINLLPGGGLGVRIWPGTLYVDGPAGVNADIELTSGTGSVYQSIKFYNAARTASSAITGYDGSLLFIDTVNGHYLRTAGGTQLYIPNTAAAVNYAQITGAATGAGPSLTAQGTDTNIPLNLSGKGTGAVILNGSGTGNVGIGTTSPGGQLDILQSTQTGSSVPVLNIATTWNNSLTTFTGIKANITSTASAIGSLLLDLQRDSSSQFSVSKTGYIDAAGAIMVRGEAPTSGTTAVSLGHSGTIGELETWGNTGLGIETGGSRRITILNTGNVGIGTTNPTTRLMVVGSGVASGPATSGTTQGTGQVMRIGGTSDAPDTVLDIGWGAGSVRHAWLQAANKAGLETNYNLVLNPNGGSVGIGTTTPSSKLDITTAGLAATQTTSSGLALVNTTAATALAPVQISPAIRWSGFGWKTDVTAASQAVDFRSHVVPVQGTANPTGYLTFESAINGGAYSGILNMTSGGNVGIGTTNPGSLLSVGATSQFQVNSNGNIAGIGATIGNNTALNLSGTLVGGGTIQRGIVMGNLTVTSSATADISGMYIGITTPNSVFTTTNVYGINIGGVSKGASHIITNYAGIAIETPPQAINATTLLLGTTTIPTGTYSIYNSSASQSYLGTGNVGIGTTTPDTTLHLATLNGTTLRLENTNTDIGSPTAIGNIEFESQDASASANGVRAKISALAEGTSGATGLAFYTTAASSTTLNEIVRINNAGNVGIGTTNPSKTLHVVGNGALINAGSSTTAFQVLLSTGNPFFTIDSTSNYIQIHDTNAEGQTRISQPSGTGLRIETRATIAGGYTERLTLRASDGNLVLGAGDGALGATNVGNTLRAPDMNGGGGANANTGGADMIIRPGLGTGTGDPGQLTIQYSPVTTAGSTIQVAESAMIFKAMAGAVSLDLNASGADRDTQIRGLNTDALFYVDASADSIGIGTTSPTLGKLQIQQSADSNTSGITLVNSGQTNSSRIWMDSSSQLRLDGNSTAATNIVLNGGGSGNVGIGTTDPGSKLHVAVASGSNAIEISNTSVGAAADWIFYPVTNGSDTDLRMFDSADRITFQAGGNVGIGTTNPGEKLQINDGILKVLHTGGTTSFMKFQQFVGWNRSMTFTSASTHMGIDVVSGPLVLNESGGNVGIGTTSPGALLSIRSTYNGPAGDLANHIEFQRGSGAGEKYYIASVGDGSEGAVGIAFRKGSTEHMRITSTGNVGIGTTNPTSGLLTLAQTDAANLEGLYINTEESTDAQAVFSIESDSTVGSGADTVHFKVTADGSVYSDANVYSTPADVAEMYFVSGGASAGDVVEVVPGANEDGFTVTKATGANTIMGVISTAPGPVMNYDWKNPGKLAMQKPVALVGRVPVKVSEENGAINVGDRLTVSSQLPGYAAKMTESGQSIGIALEASTGGSEGLDTILVFVNLGYQKIQVAQSEEGTLLVEENYDFSNHSIINVKNIASMSGAWSINEDGTIVAKKLCLEEVCIDKTQLQQLLELVGGSSSSSSGGGTTAGETTTAPESTEGSTEETTTGETTPPASEEPVTTETTPTEETTSVEPAPEPAPEPTPEPAPAPEPPADPAPAESNGGEVSAGE